MVAALQRVAEAYEQRGEYEQALVFAQRQIALEPWLEETHRQVMRILALSGRRSAAPRSSSTRARTRSRFAISGSKRGRG